MRSADFCNDDQIAEMVHRFYARVRTDPLLGPIFSEHVADWDAHLRTLVDFWSSILRGTTRFQGTPMARHAALPGLTAEHFERWLALFHETTAEHPNTAMTGRARLLAGRIAQSLWYGYQGIHCPGVAPATLGRQCT